MIQPEQLTEPTVRAFVTAVNGGDKEGFRALLTPDVTMSDDGSDRDVDDWTEREIWSSDGRMQVESESSGGRELVVDYSNSTWGSMRTTWRFDVTDDGRVSRFETGQA
ncbi:nuclear transport factor 2 family protein [Streptomyces sp. NPDC001941]|uniref:nuclear transport factor 2 family protein n=1 Tax=Streptomyces sp. NPDC001941 TaxID=3154659 RepID=UPI003331DB60